MSTLNVAELPIAASAPPFLPGAACVGLPTEYFFADLALEERKLSEDWRVYAAMRDRALRACAECPAQPACREWALREPALVGIMGGLTTAQRRHLQRDRGRVLRRELAASSVSPTG